MLVLYWPCINSITSTISDSCTNRNAASCNLWAQSGECLKNTGWMLTNCRRACNACPDPPPPTTTTTTWAPPTTPGIQVLLHIDQHEDGVDVINITSYHLLCPATQGRDIYKYGSIWTITRYFLLLFKLLPFYNF